MTGTVVIVGASVAGVRTAQALRGEGHTGRIVLVGAEPDEPYDKPPLSKQFLMGTQEAPRITLLTSDDATAAGIELRLGVGAAHLDVAGKAVVLASGERLDYAAVVLATGAAARPSPWAVASGVHVLRTLADSSGLRSALAAHDTVVVVGGGFIGAEVASTASAAGRHVTLVDPLPAPMSRQVGSDVAALLGQVHARHGVSTRFGVGAVSVVGGAGALRVTLTDGSALSAGTVVVGIGATPADGWLASSGLLVDDGVVCDRYCRAVDNADVYAAGDVARWFHPRYGELVRVEHWTNAVDQAACVAHNLTHPDDLREYAPVEYVWTDQYDWRIQLVGRPHRGTGMQIFGVPDADRPRFAAVYGDADGQFTGAVVVNWPKALVSCRRLAEAWESFGGACEQIATLALALSASARPPAGPAALTPQAGAI
jgi:phthalate 3,4-dioxygenase ferredoxin reductase component